MNKQTRRMAVSGMMVALATAIMLLGGVIPAATFVAPALAGIVLIPVLFEGGRRMALGAWLAISALGLILCASRSSTIFRICRRNRFPIHHIRPSWAGIPR